MKPASAFPGRLVAMALVLFVPATAMAHAYVMKPPSRDVGTADLDARAKKKGPCGGSPRVGKPTQYSPGQTIEVKWQETIGHKGCFQIVFSPADDKNWVTLKQINDPAGNPDDMIYTDNVKLPAGVTCKACTLGVRQLMLEGMAVTTCSPDAAPPPNDTYYSCADIRVGEFGDAGDTLPPDVDDAGTSSGGPSTVPTDGGGNTTTGSSSGRKLTPVSAGDEGCSVGAGASSGLSLFASVGLGLVALARWRRRRS